MVYTRSGESCSRKEMASSDVCHDADEAGKHHAEISKVVAKEQILHHLLHIKQSSTEKPRMISGDQG